MINEWFVLPNIKLKTESIKLVQLYPGELSANQRLRLPYLVVVVEYHITFEGSEALHAIEALRVAGFYTITEHMAAKMCMTRFLREYQNLKKEATVND